MKLIVGLGNIGEEYCRTRHNVGFRVIDRVVQFLKGTWSEFESGEWCVINDTVFFKPGLYMNQSGPAVKQLINYYKWPLDKLEIVLIQDEIDLEIGRIKIQIGGGAAGHKGVISIQETLEGKIDQLIRVRIGVGRGSDMIPTDRWVLMVPLGRDFKVLKEAEESASQVVQQLLVAPLDRVMNAFN